MSQNKISAEITQEQETQVVQSIKDARTALPFLVNLTSVDRIRLAKLSRKRVDFVNGALIEARLHPGYLLPFVSLEEFEKDVTLMEALNRIRAEVQSLTQRIDDTILLVGSEAYQAARVFTNP